MKKLEKKGPSDYKEPYEFRLLIGDSIICQRYFKINNFNPISLNSFELLNTIRRCANLIDEDLKSKTRIYSWYMAPLVFNSLEEAKNWFSNPKNSLSVRFHETVVIKDNDSTEYSWDGEKLVLCDKKICDGTFVNELTDRDTSTYEFAFYVNGKKVISTCFDGIYPNYIRRNIDLSNTRGKFEGDDLSKLGFESYILNKLVSGRTDLIKKVVKEICNICSMTDNSFYTTSDKYKTTNKNNITYNFDINNQKYLDKKFAKEIAKANKYLKELY